MYDAVTVSQLKMPEGLTCKNRVAHTPIITPRFILRDPYHESKRAVYASLVVGSRRDKDTSNGVLVVVPRRSFFV